MIGPIILMYMYTIIMREVASTYLLVEGGGLQTIVEMKKYKESSRIDKSMYINSMSDFDRAVVDL